MPGSVSNAAPVGVLPQSLCTAFAEVRQVPFLESTYHDGAVQRVAQAATSRKQFRLVARLTAEALEELRAFYDEHDGGMTPFYFYDPYDVPAGDKIGSNYDPTGVSQVGRYTMRFEGGWSQTSGMARSEVNLTLVELA